jgi:hypothetical protein
MPFSSGAKFRNGGTSSFFGGTVLMRGSSVAAKTPFVDLAIALHSVLARFARQLPHLVHVAADGFGEVGEIVRQQIGVGKAHHGNVPAVCASARP